ncbi:Peptidyl-prolyl cis-trans isomerase FKBP62 [Hondaea fermentalgiana]|uniref:peptidylprolyl isomerase n=1 Tax=Hondaea fermentalgiana TaxID=2315210 RepID=A0A2R5GWF4_9STRA|nr:Peptidyl-prolyl cis-trans isomerase FKBP62 [Hondaea fermentalgiana]|eukprot:GBG32741.1 Peptidyl-prolyl cis-trans isomerase FKBP62 [Hondaea fermentalgiana]
MQRCSRCGGRGKDLVRYRGGRCAHCIREENRATLRPSSFIQRQLDEGFVDISETGDYSLLKKTIRAAPAGSPQPAVGCPTRIHVVGRLWDERTQAWPDIFETTRDVVEGKHVGGTDDPYEVMLGRFSQDTVDQEYQREQMDPMYVALGRCQAWDQALLTMRKDEVAAFVCAPQLAYGAQGYAPKVGPHESVLFEFEIVDWDRALPPIPSRDELERSRMEREAEDRARYEANPPPSVDERLGLAETERERGNDAFKAGKLEEAKKLYDRAFVTIFFSKEEYSQILSEEERNRVGACKHILHLNRALCKLKLNMLDEAMWDCDQALEIDPESVKGLFRRAQVHCALLRGEFAKEERREFWVLEHATDMLKAAREDYRLAHSLLLHEPEDGILSKGEWERQKRALAALRKDLVVLEKLLREHAVRYRAEEKNLFHNKIFQPMARANAENQARERAQEQKTLEEDALAALEDMPALED